MGDLHGAFQPKPLRVSVIIIYGNDIVVGTIHWHWQCVLNPTDTSCSQEMLHLNLLHENKLIQERFLRVFFWKGMLGSCQEPDSRAIPVLFLPLLSGRGCQEREHPMGGRVRRGVALCRG